MHAKTFLPITRWVGNSHSVRLGDGSTYETVDAFLVDLKAGSLKEQFFLRDDMFCEMAERINRGDKELAAILCDSGVLALLMFVLRYSMGDNRALRV